MVQDEHERQEEGVSASEDEGDDYWTVDVQADWWEAVRECDEAGFWLSSSFETSTGHQQQQQQQQRRRRQQRTKHHGKVAIKRGSPHNDDDNEGSDGTARELSYVSDVPRGLLRVGSFSAQQRQFVAQLELHDDDDDQAPAPTAAVYSTVVRAHVQLTAFDGSPLAAYGTGTNSNVNSSNNDNSDDGNPPPHTYNTPCLAIDVSPGGSLALMGGRDGRLCVWATQRQQQQQEGRARIVERPLDLDEAHVGDVNVAKFFPSGEVALSGSSDTQLKVWSVNLGLCAATLRGHSGGVLDVAFVDRGRNVVSVARDGRLRLWDIASQQSIHTFFDDNALSRRPSPINSCSIAATTTTTTATATTTAARDEREVGTDGKIVAVGLESGAVRLVDLRQRQVPVGGWSLGSGRPTNYVTFLSPSSVLAAGGEGQVRLWDTRMVDSATPLRRWSLGRSSDVLCGTVASGVAWLGTSDGRVVSLWEEGGLEPLLSTATPPSASFTTTVPPVHLSGSDCEPIYSLAAHSRNLFAACRDRCVRQYRV